MSDVENEIDLGPIILYPSDNKLHINSIYMPDLVQHYKSYKGKWNNNRKIWIIENNNIKQTVDSIIKFLQERAPKNWEVVAKKLVQFCPVTNRFQMSAGVAGIRLMLPDGHILEESLKTLENIKRERDIWNIDSTLCINPGVIKVIKKMSEEDKEKFLLKSHWMSNREVKGFLNITEQDIKKVKLEENNIVFMAMSFLKESDPRYAESMIKEYPALVKNITHKKDNIYEVSLKYMDKEKAYEILQKRIFNKDIYNQKPLNVSYVVNKWDSNIKNDVFS